MEVFALQVAKPHFHFSFLDRPQSVRIYEMVELVSKIVDLNNEAAYQLQSGQPMAALRLLQGAIGLIKEHQPLYPPTNSNAMGISVFTTTAMNLFPHSIDMQEAMIPVDGVVYVYKRPLCLPLYPKMSSADELDSFMNMTSAYLIFNFALACQEVGRQSGMDAPIQRAIQLYEYFVATVWNQLESKCQNMENQNMATRQSSYCAMLQCIALNNLSFLHYEQCNYDKSLYYMECVRSIMRGTTGRCFMDTSLCHGSSWELEEFLLNPMYLRVPSAAHAA